MTYDVMFFLIAGPAVAFAGLSKGGFGSGPAFMASSILTLVLDPAVAIGIMLPLLILMDIGGLKAYWLGWDKTEATRLIIGSIPGIALGALLFRSTNPDVLRLLIGGMSIAFVLHRVAQSTGFLRPRTEKNGALVGYVAGLVSGFTSFVSHAGGPPSSMYLLSQRLGKTTYQATTVITFFAINGFKIFPYAALGIFSQETLLADIYLAPFALIGVWIGVKAHKIVPENIFFGFTYVMLIGTGVKLIFDALT